MMAWARFSATMDPARATIFQDVMAVAADALTIARPAAASFSSAHLRGLLWTLIRTDFKARYHGTLGGFAWALMKPLTMFVVLAAVFSFVFAAAPGYVLNLLLGIFLYDFFSESTRSGFVSLAAKGFLLSKAKFPSWIVVIASTANAGITLSLFWLVLLLFLTVTGNVPAVSTIPLIGLYLLCFAATVVGISLAGSVLFLRYRDLNQVWDVVLQAGFFAAPIVYPLGVIPERLHFYLYLWPPTAVIQFTRAVLIDGVPPTLKANLLLVVQSCVILAIGVAIFRRYARRVAEYL
jgi:lipopolysaccharide transport system permease protein